MNELTQKQENFCLAYIETGNASEARPPACMPSNPEQMGKSGWFGGNLKKPEIQQLFYKGRNNLFIPFTFHADITGLLTCPRNSRYPVCALKKDGAGLGRSNVYGGRTATSAVFFMSVCLLYGQIVREAFGPAGFLERRSANPQALVHPFSSGRQVLNLFKETCHV